MVKIFHASSALILSKRRESDRANVSIPRSLARVIAKNERDPRARNAMRKHESTMARY